VLSKQASRFLFRLAPAIAIAVAGVLSLSSRANPAHTLSASLTDGQEASCLRGGDAGRASEAQMSVAGASGVSAPATPTAFRLGTAARPYAWSTGIADFNKDGAPDVAIADRVGHDGGSYEYRLEISVSGLESETVSLQSEQEAITVGVSDIDHDNDLDVVVSGVLSHEIVGVWVNDGHGRFDRSQITASAVSASEATIGTDDRYLYPLAANLSSQLLALKSSRARSPGSRQQHGVTGHYDRTALVSEPSSQPSRAPPPDLLVSII